MEGRTSSNRFMRIITIPIRALGKARDLYVKSMNSYANNGCYSGGATFGFSVSEPLPRSFSTNSVRSSEDGSDDLTELIRASSSRVFADKLDLNALNQQQHRPRFDRKPPLPPNRQRNTANGYAKGVPRSASVSMAKIDEDKPCDFEERMVGTGKGNNRKTKKTSGLFSRSRSYAV